MPGAPGGKESYSLVNTRFYRFIMPSWVVSDCACSVRQQLSTTLRTNIQSIKHSAKGRSNDQESTAMCANGQGVMLAGFLLHHQAYPYVFPCAATRCIAPHVPRASKTSPTPHQGMNNPVQLMNPITNGNPNPMTSVESRLATNESQKASPLGTDASRV